MHTLEHNWPYMLIPILVTILGGLIAANATLPPAVRSTVQHFTAGVVFAAIAGEVIPDVIDRHAPLATVAGFVVGVALMFGISKATDALNPEDEHTDTPIHPSLDTTGTDPAIADAETARSPAASTTTVAAVDVAARRPGRGGLPLPLIAAVGIDGLVDGLVIGIGFTVGSQLGTLVAVALSLEMFFLGLSAAATLRQNGSSPRFAVAVTSAAASMIAIGALLGVTVLGSLPSAGLAAVLAFGAAALLYLVTEELLNEAHTVPETRLMSSLFFGGFLVLLIIEMSL